jgi:putative transposase
VKLTDKCRLNGIELRVVDRFYPSSKLCNHCGNVNKMLKLKDRVYICHCGYEADRDVNASRNLRDATVYDTCQPAGGRRNSG